MMSTTGKLPALGATAAFSKTLGESDVSLFAGLTGDMAPQHIDEAYMHDHPMGTRIVHGTLVLALTSTAAARLSEQEDITVVSYGYDRVRFIRPVLLGQTVEARATVESIDEETGKIMLASEVRTKPDGDLVAVVQHILFRVA
jgi:3-hydroxybutyryl-CoA dehydratase